MIDKFEYGEPTKIKVDGAYVNGKYTDITGFWIYATYCGETSEGRIKLRLINGYILIISDKDLPKLTKKELEDYTMAILEDRDIVQVLEN